MRMQPYTDTAGREEEIEGGEGEKEEVEREFNGWVDSYTESVEKISQFYEETLRGLQRRLENSRAGLLFTRREIQREDGEKQDSALQTHKEITRSFLGGSPAGGVEGIA